MRKKKWLTILIVIGALVVVLLLAWAIWFWSAQRQLDAKLDDLRLRGEPLTAADLRPPDIPDNENGAVLYGEAFVSLDLLPETTKHAVAILAEKRKPLTSEDIDQARGWLKDIAEPLRLVHEAGLRPKCRFPITYADPAGDIALGHLSRITLVSRLLSLSAQVNLADNKPDMALGNCADMLSMTRAQDSEPFFISFLEAKSVNERALSRLKAVLDGADPSPEALASLLPFWRKPVERERLICAMQGERCIGLSPFQLAFGSAVGTGSAKPNVTPYRISPLRPLLVSDELYFLETMDKVIAAAGKPMYESTDAWKKIDEQTSPEHRSIFHPISNMLIVSLLRAGAAFDDSVAITGCAQQAVALRLFRLKHGEYPEKLSQLVPEFLDKLPVDPFSGKAYVYRKEGKGFIVYSWGENLRDDDGADESTNHKAGDIVWKCSR